jgi:hypothetical protein
MLKIVHLIMERGRNWRVATKIASHGTHGGHGTARAS